MRNQLLSKIYRCLSIIKKLSIINPLSTKNIACYLKNRLQFTKIFHSIAKLSKLNSIMNCQGIVQPHPSKMSLFYLL